MLWRPFCPPFCLHEADMSEINFIMLKRFLDLKNLYVATKIMCLAQILKKTLRILSFGGHLGRHLEYFNFPKVASFSYNVRTYWRTHLCKNILCGLFFWVAPKIFIWQPDYRWCWNIYRISRYRPINTLENIWLYCRLWDLSIISQLVIAFLYCCWLKESLATCCWPVWLKAVRTPRL